MTAALIAGIGGVGWGGLGAVAAAGESGPATLATARELDVSDAIVTDVQTLQAASGLTFTAARVHSFGFSDAELSELRVVVRPYDTTYADLERTDELDEYEIEIAVMTMVSRTDVAGIDNYFNLSVAIMALYPIGRAMTVGAGQVVVTDKRWFPMVFRSQGSTTVPGIMDDPTQAQTRFLSTRILKLREIVQTGP
jgi:hypothetical protein